MKKTVLCVIMLAFVVTSAFALPPEPHPVANRHIKIGPMSFSYKTHMNKDSIEIEDIKAFEESMDTLDGSLQSMGNALDSFGKTMDTFGNSVDSFGNSLHAFAPPFGIFDTFISGVFGIALIMIGFYILIFGGIIFIFVYFIRSNQKREKQRQELILKCIESGQPIPEYLKDNSSKKQRYLKHGIIWSAVGLGLYFIISSLAAIPIFVGVAYIILYAMEKDYPANNNNVNE